MPDFTSAFETGLFSRYLQWNKFSFIPISERYNQSE